MKTEFLIAVILLGIGASATMDLWGLFLKRAFNTPTPNYCLVGRWLLHMPGGVFRHKNINAAAQKPAECATGWIAHCIIGVLFASAFVALATPEWLRAPSLWPALGFGIVTVVIPFFIMQPAFGLGPAAARAPNFMQARLRSLMNHAAFGLGLYLSALLIGFLFRT
ncbi:MAG TPA: DUF2938 domain-containing protein [Gammaproteobacteria bacterium]|nr:DUF2938 domain-containing protein [Gammaproteobacteria bacterium]